MLELLTDLDSHLSQSDIATRLTDLADDTYRQILIGDQRQALSYIDQLKTKPTRALSTAKKVRQIEKLSPSRYTQPTLSTRVPVVDGLELLVDENFTLPEEPLALQDLLRQFQSSLRTVKSD